MLNIMDWPGTGNMVLNRGMMVFYFVFHILIFLYIYFLKRIMLNILALNRKGGVEQDYQEYHLLQISKVVKVTS